MTGFAAVRIELGEHRLDLGQGIRRNGHGALGDQTQMFGGYGRGGFHDGRHGRGLGVGRLNGGLDDFTGASRCRSHLGGNNFQDLRLFGGNRMFDRKGELQAIHLSGRREQGKRSNENTGNQGLFHEG